MASNSTLKTRVVDDGYEKMRKVLAPFRAAELPLEAVSKLQASAPGLIRSAGRR
jgi:hypothetical protein